MLTFSFIYFEVYRNHAIQATKLCFQTILLSLTLRRRKLRQKRFTLPATVGSNNCGFARKKEKRSGSSSHRSLS
ncbi:hypothetical protein GJ744_011058 [Endocarpon pusillum]|uniref:Uncharacterized protein n=1 Tax=Endocarpon pusillum TaxID=364733 RepID=A0A8H7AFJ0_9EURO|nr:hypothetical protein GJ744_011058 [Endocarpon pusillum]